MTLNDLYATVSRFTDITQGRFIALYNMTVSELLGEYGEKHLLLSDDRSVKTVSDSSLCFAEYDNAIINNILYLDNENRTINKEMSLSQREAAYRTVWSKNNKRTISRPRNWE